MPNAELSVCVCVRMYVSVCVRAGGGRRDSEPPHQSQLVSVPNHRRGAVEQIVVHAMLAVGVHLRRRNTGDTLSMKRASCLERKEACSFRRFSSSLFHGFCGFSKTHSGMRKWWVNSLERKEASTRKWMDLSVIFYLIAHNSCLKSLWAHGWKLN